MAVDNIRNVPCPLCKRAMVYQKDGIDNLQVFTCRKCLAEVTVNVMHEDRDIADFLENYYPEKDDKVKNGG